MSPIEKALISPATLYVWALRLKYPTLILLFFILSLNVIVLMVVGGCYGECVQKIHKQLEQVPNVVIHRALVSTISIVLISLTPDFIYQSVTSSLLDFLNTDLWKDILALRKYEPRYSTNPDLIYKTFIGIVLVPYVFLVGFICVFYKLARHLLPSSEMYAICATLTMLLLVQSFARSFSYYYDSAELFFSALTFYLLCQRRWRAYCISLIFAFMNKETAIFTVGFYFVYFLSQLPRDQYIRLGIIQVCIFAIVKISISLYFYHFGSLSMSAGGYQNMIRYSFSNLVCLAFVSLLVFYKFMEMPAILRAAFIIVLLNYTGYRLFCYQGGEYRDLYWCMPLLVLMGAHGFVKLTQLDKIAFFRAQ